MVLVVRISTYLIKAVILPLLLCFLYFSSTAYSASVNSPTVNNKVLKLVAPDFPPYSYLKNGKPAGIGVDKIRQIMNASKINYSIDIVKDYGIALLLMNKGIADGFFLASKNIERDNIAVFSKPILTNRWCWYFKAGSGLTPLKRRFKRNAKVGTILNTNTHKWLKKNKYRVVGKPDNARSLNKMLLANRINAVFLSEQVFEYVIQPSQYYLYKKIIEVEKPFGIYISKQYLAKHPKTLDSINNAITSLAN